MKLLGALGFSLLVCSARAFELDDFVDRVDSALTFAQFAGNLRARLSGTLDVEFYHFQQPAPGLINSKIDNLFNPRLSLFVDTQLGSQFYFFAQSRVDRGFDPSARGAAIRLDEYARRFTPWEDRRFNLEVGKFATSSETGSRGIRLGKTRLSMRRLFTNIFCRSATKPGRFHQTRSCASLSLLTNMNATRSSGARAMRVVCLSSDDSRSSITPLK